MKKLLSMLFVFFITFQSFSQVDSIFGTYVSLAPLLGNFPHITLHADNTFTYRAPIDVGDVPETSGYLEFIEDTVYFKYPTSIYPEIEIIEAHFNPERRNILLEVSGNIGANQGIVLYVNEPSTRNGKILPLKGNVLELDSVQVTDSLFLHVYYHFPMPIVLELENFNEYHCLINLPEEPTVYYLTRDRALVKNGLLYFSMEMNEKPYYNTRIFKSKKDFRKLRNGSWKNP